MLCPRYNLQRTRVKEGAMLTRRMFVAGAVPLAARAASKKIDEATGPRFFVAALTALDERRNFDPARAKDYLAYLAANGVEGALVLGTTGEFASFSVQERDKIREVASTRQSEPAVVATVGVPQVP